jgi:phosphonate transport system substrate-binding protein
MNRAFAMLRLTSIRELRPLTDVEVLNHLADTETPQGRTAGALAAAEWARLSPTSSPAQFKETQPLLTMMKTLTLCTALAMATGCTAAEPTPAEATSTAEAATGAAPKAPEGVAIIRITGIPDENPTELQRKYQPMVDYLQKTLGATVTYVPVTDYGAAVAALVAGQVDFAWLGGFTHVQARHQAKVVPLVMRAIDREFKSVIVANTASGITEVAGVKGKTFAFGSKSSTSGHLMPRHFLSTQFKLDVATDLDGQPVYSGAHDATAKIVESGKVAAGALNKQVWERMVKQGKVDTNKVKVIWTTPGYVDYVWTARSAVPQAQRDAFAQAFMDLQMDTPADKAVLDLQGAKRFVPGTPADFDAIEGVAKSTGLLK